jgi:hypothetical protein
MTHKKKTGSRADLHYTTACSIMRSKSWSASTTGPVIESCCSSSTNDAAARHSSSSCKLHFLYPFAIVSALSPSQPLRTHLHILERPGGSNLNFSPSARGLFSCACMSSCHSCRSPHLNGKFHAASAGWQTEVAFGGTFIRTTLIEAA